jgi:hypothetical protein
MAVLWGLFALTTMAGWIANVWTPKSEHFIYDRGYAGDAESIALPLWIGEYDRFFFATDRTSLNLCAFGFPSEERDPGQTQFLSTELRSLERDRWSLFHERRWFGFHVCYGHMIYEENVFGISEIDYQYGIGIPVALAVKAQLFLARVFWYRARRITTAASPPG